jgi:hypothetical protein
MRPTRCDRFWKQIEDRVEPLFDKMSGEIEAITDRLVRECRCRPKCTREIIRRVQEQAFADHLRLWDELKESKAAEQLKAAESEMAVPRTTRRRRRAARTKPKALRTKAARA